MPAKNCFILAAGLGTRMGAIGLALPKPLFPFFEMRLLDIQIKFAQQLGANKILINTHHLSDQVVAYLESKYTQSQIITLFEPQLLDVGGGIHNAASKLGYRGQLLVLNSDVIYFLSKTDHDNFFTKSDVRADVQLLGLPVEKKSAYNEIEISGKDNWFQGVHGPNLHKDYVTYSGICWVNLEKLTPIEGKTNFFESVACPLHLKTNVFIPSQKFEYWDFGTKQLYWKNIIDIFVKFENNEKNLMIDFLLKNYFLKTESMTDKKYVAKNSGFVLDAKKSSIFLDGIATERHRPGIYYQNIFEPLGPLL